MILCLAGGVGGARLADGLCRRIPSGDLGVIVNTGDDFEHLGLRISPDLDTVMYTLSGLADPDRGWGIADETWNFMTALEALGGPAWFRLGDHDLATHVERTRRLGSGELLSAVTADFCRRLGVEASVAPMSDNPVRTIVRTAEGPLDFQDYFVRRACEPPVEAFEFRGSDRSRPSVPVASWIAGNVEAVIYCPSNPFVSIAPILAVPEIGRFAGEGRPPAVAVSPIIGGSAVKGPAAKMMRELGLECSPLGIARYYAGKIDGLVIDYADAALADDLRALGIASLVTDAIMRGRDDRVRLAGEVLDFAGKLGGEGSRS